MKMKPGRLIVTVMSVALVAASGLAMASSLTPTNDGVHVAGYDLSEYGIAPASWTNFENAVKVRIAKKGKGGSKGTLLRVTGNNGAGNYFNLEPADNFTIKGSSYKLKARFDADGNLLKGGVKVNGTIKTEEGRVSGRLLTASLGGLLSDQGYAFTNNLLGFNTYNTKCHAAIESITPGGCESGESAYVSLDKNLAAITRKYQSSGLAVTGSADLVITNVPVPAAVWLFASGLIGLTGMARRRKH
jgi:hypothetical protein